MLKKLLLLLGIGVVAFIVWFAGIFMYWRIWDIQNTWERKITVENFKKEIVEVPEMKINSYVFVGEGSTLHVQFEIGDKGLSSFLYGGNEILGIENLGSHKTWYDCFYVDSNGKRVSYAGATELLPRPDSSFKKWFPFEVKSLRDLVVRYDEIVKILKTLPVNPINSGNMGGRETIKEPNVNYVFYKKIGGRNVSCDFLQFQ